MINLEKKHSMCDFCGVMIFTKDIYVDYSLDEYAGLCREHFYRKYENNITGYYNLVKFFDDTIITADEFEVKKNIVTGIHYEFNFPESEYGLFDEENKEKFRQITYSDIITEKNRHKFEFIEIEKSEDYADDIFILRYDLKVLFKSYLEYLENQLFLSLRNHFLESYRESVTSERVDPAILC
jgi:hypothetical protein